MPLSIAPIASIVLATTVTMADPVIKAEPGASPAPVDEEDLYEDAGDLEFYDKNAPGNSFETLYLARVPKYMWDAWLKLTERLGDDDEVQIGTLRTWNERTPDANVEGGVRESTKLRMLLQANQPEHQLLPREYDLEVLDQDVQNHFVFSEEDLPGFKERSKARTDAANSGIPMSILRARAQAQSGEQPQKQPYDRNRRYQPYYRKAVPSSSPPFRDT